MLGNVRSFVRACCICLAFSTSVTKGANLKQAPHIVFILADDVGWNDVAYHGSPQFETPTINALAVDGVVLERYYVTATCSPTRASILSGRAMIHHGIFVPFGSLDTASGLNLTYTLLPEHLQQDYGYTTAMVGKWHLGMKTARYLPSQRGFNHSFCFYQGMMDYWRHYNDGCNGGPCNGLDLHENSVGGTGVNDTDVYNTVGDYSSGMFARRAASLITQHGFLGTNGKSPPPFFLYLAFQNGHSGNNKYLQAPDYYFTLDDINSISPNTTCGQYQVTGECINEDPGHGAASRKSSAAQIRALDDGIDGVVSALKQASMWDNTLLVFSSDNGGPTDGGDNNMNNNFPLRGCKGGYFDGGLRVPALVSGGIYSGIMDSARGAVVHNGYHHATDWLPTLLTAAKRGATGDLSAYHGAVTLKTSEREFLPGDGLDNWDFISTGGIDHAKPSARTEIAHAVQANGSDLNFTALVVGDMKILWHPSGTDCGKTHAGWYPPPGLAWNYAGKRLTIQCAEPPTNPPIDSVCTTTDPCLFNITKDPCEYHDLSSAAAFSSILEDLLDSVANYKKTTVVPYTVFSKNSKVGDPRNFPPVENKDIFVGVWTPYMTDDEDNAYYPTNYSGPGYM